MLVFAQVPVSLLSLTFDRRPDLVALVKGRPGFTQLCEDVEKNGILDPCLVQRYPDRYQMETGGQRLLLARDKGIASLLCFVYDKNGGEIDIPYLERITNVEAIHSLFRNQNVPSLLDILGYIQSGVITLS